MLVFVELSSEGVSAIGGNSKAIQVDGGSEFEAIFREECQKKRMCHYSYERVHNNDTLCSFSYDLCLKGSEWLVACF